MDSESPPPRHSLFDRAGAALVERVRGARLPREAASRRDWMVACVIVALMIAGPLLTWVGAVALADRNATALSQANRRLAPRLAERRAWERSRTDLARLYTQPTLAETVSRLARALPQGATLDRASRDVAGAMTIRVATTDPDALRAALRRDPELARLRDIDQASGNGAMIVTLKAAP